MTMYMGTVQPVELPENWSQMTREEKREYRLNNYLSTEGIKFVSPEAEKNYRIRAQRMVDVYNVTEPDRVPVNLPVGSLPLTMVGLNMHTSMYEPEKAIDAYMKFNEQYSEELEVFTAPMGGLPGRVLELLDYKLYYWPGRGLPENASSWQFIEGEYMTADEYDALILDPTDFWLRTYMPRIFGTLEPFRMFQPFTNITENVHVGQFAVFSSPQMQDTLQKFIDVGKEYQKSMEVTMKYAGLRAANGFPGGMGAFCKAPFDIIGDSLRGTAGIMKDMYRYPDKLLQALDVIADVYISNILNSPMMPRLTMVSYPLHKGADGWMSQKQFDTFYWPSMKKVMDAFIEEGLIQSLFAEGAYNTRLEAVNVFPKGTVHWYFDQTDMFKAKEILGKNCSIQGNVPISMVVTGSPAEVKEYSVKLIEGCGKGGGYVLSAGTIAENPKLENLRAMMEAIREYGYYKK
jgi:uroporphyrinogen-III decarboxylase